MSDLEAIMSRLSFAREASVRAASVISHIWDKETFAGLREEKRSDLSVGRRNPAI